MNEEKVIMIEHDTKGIHYFSDVTRVAKILGTTIEIIEACLRHQLQYRGWTISYVYNNNIIPKFFNPEKI